MQNAECIEMFEKYLKEDKNASANTLSSYLRDIRQLGEYLDANSEHGIVDASAEDLSEYIETLRAEGKSVATVSRSIASIKCLYSHLFIKLNEKSSEKNLPVNAKNLPVNLPVNKVQAELISFLKENPSYTYDDLAEKINRTRETVRVNLRKLENMNLIKRVGADKNGHWVVSLPSSK